MRTAIRVAAASALLSFLAGAALAAPAATTRASVSTSGAQGLLASGLADVSSDGRWVVFDSASSTLVDGDTNGVSDVFVRDRATGTTARVSVRTGGAQAGGPSDSGSISADGRWVVFTSTAPDLVDGDTNGQRDVFLHDRATATTRRVSVQSGGAQAFGNSFTPQISADGRFVAFFTFSDLAGTGAQMASVNAYRVDLATGQVEDLCERWDGVRIRLCLGPSISGDGRYVAFEAQGALVESDTNGWPDVYVRDLVARVTTRVSVRTSGAQGDNRSQAPSISANGRIVAFSTWATNLVVGDANGSVDVLARDLVAGTTELVSVGVGGAAAGGNSFTRAFNGGSRTVSDDGRYVAFHSFASDLVAVDANGAFDVFVRDRVAATTRMASLTWDERQGTGNSTNAALSGDGRFVAFESTSAGLVVGDTNGVRDVFVRDMRPNTPPALSLPGDAQVHLGDALALSGSFSDPDLDQAWSGTVSWGDGTSGALALGGDKTFPLAHTYASLGTYTVQVTLQDGAGGTAAGSFTVTVTPRPVSYAGNRAGMTLRVQLDARAADFGRVWLDVPGTGTYVVDAAAGMRSPSPTVVLIDHTGPATLQSAAGTTPLTVRMRGRIDPGRNVAELTLADSVGREFRIVATP